MIFAFYYWMKYYCGYLLHLLLDDIVIIKDEIWIHESNKICMWMISNLINLYLISGYLLAIKMSTYWKKKKLHRISMVTRNTKHLIK